MAAEVSPVTRQVIEQAVRQQRSGGPLFIVARSVLTFCAGSRATSARRGAPNRDQTSQQGEIMMAIAAMT